MQHCSQQETLFRFFYNVSTSFFLLLIFIHYSSIFLAKLFHFVGSYPLIYRSQNEYDYNLFSEEEEEEEEFNTNEGYFHENQYVHHHHGHHLVAEIIDGGDSLVFLHKNNQEIVQDDDDDQDSFDTPQYSSNDLIDEVEQHRDDDDDDDDSSVDDMSTSHVTTQVEKRGLVDSDENFNEQFGVSEKKVEANSSGDEKFYLLGPTSQLKSRRRRMINVEDEDDEEEEEIFGDSCTMGSTSKSSSEWRSSITYRDSGMEDPFSSSSRRSCPKWESYTVFQKYDEEMMFLDRVSAQKLQETESLRSIQACPRSISERIVHKLVTINKKSTDVKQNPYHELEAAYVAQICLTWEALNWNYINFHRKKAASRKEFEDIGCPAHVAQQLQQFQVLLQRYVENEPYEHGRRPEVYARVRLLAPKLLLVPEYRDSEDDQQKEGFGSRISSGAFVMIMEDGIRTFMNFLKADKERTCQKLKSFLGIHRRSSVDPTLLNLIKKVNTKKKKKLKDLRRSQNCIRKKRLTVDEEMEILMGQIDLKVVSRVLRMSDLSEEQLHWCEAKMSKVRVLEGKKLQRDSTPLFFPAH